MVNVGVTLSYREHEGERVYVVYLTTAHYRDDGTSETMGISWTLEGAKAGFDADTEWRKAEDMAIWSADIDRDLYVIEEVPVI